MALSDPFESPISLIDRARDHIEEASTKIEAFFDRKPYARVVDIDPETGQEVHKIRVTAQIPGKLNVIVKDATTNLRDALDHAVYASAVALGNSAPKDTGFPFARDAKGVAGELDGPRLSGNPPEIRPYLASLEPHEAGNQLLVALNRIRNPNTHRTLVPVGHATASIGGSFQGELRGPGQLGYSRWDAEKNEVEFMRIGRGSNLKYDLQATFHVAFGDVQIIAGQDVLGTLNAMATEVERVVLGIKAETARIIRERS